MRHARGFTLLELIVAITLMLVVTGALFSSLYIASRSSHAAQAALQPVRQAALALELLRQDFDAVTPPRGVLSAAFQTPTSTGSAQFDALTFYAASNTPRDQEIGGDIRKVELYVTTPPDDTQPALYRRLTANLLASQQPIVHEQVLCRNMIAFKFRYFDGSVWQTSWDSTAVNNVAPLAIEVTLEFARPDSKTPNGVPATASSYRIVRVFPCLCGKTTSQSATGGSS